MLDQPPSILQVVPALNTGGVERGTIDIAIALKKLGWNSFVTSAGGLMQRELERAGVEHLTLPLATKNPFIMHKNSLKIATFIYEKNIDIVHARSRAPAWSSYFAAKRMQVNFITTFHGTYNYGNSIKKIYNSIMCKGQITIAISNFIFNHIKDNYRVEDRNLRVIPRGINLQNFDPVNVSAERIVQLFKLWNLPDGVPVIMLPARLTRWKGHEVLIEAISNLKTSNIVCIFVGDENNNKSSYKKDLEQLIKSKNLESIFRFVGNCQDMPAAYMLSDIVVTASTDEEAFGRVAIEAQAMGCMVIGSNHGGTKETVLEKETGWLFENSNASQLSKIITNVLSIDNMQRSKIAKKSRKHIEGMYSLERMQEKTIEVYKEILSL